jgi:hypothetical protein
MLDLLVKVAAVAAAYWAVDEGVKAISGERIHTHVLGWWDALRDTISEWLGENQHLGIVQVVGCLVCKLDDLAITTRKAMSFFVKAVDAQQQTHTIQVLEVSADELARKFPNLKLDNTVTLEMAT